MLGLKNNFIFAPIKLGYSKDGKVNKRHIRFYKLRSKYVGAVTVEPFFLDPGLREIPTQLGIDNDSKIESLKQLTDTIHKNNTKVIAHLNHPGRMANPKIKGNYFISSTDKPCKKGLPAPKIMDEDDMERVIELYINAIRRIEQSGFDIIELQYGHGYLMAQFLSPAVNNRTDEYGKGYEGRIKFPLRVFKTIKKHTNLPIIVRISANEMMENGINTADMINFSKLLEREGAEAIHVSSGSVCSTPPWYFQHMFIPKGKTWEWAKKIKEHINIPVIAVGRINTFEDIEKVVQIGIDYIGIGRALVADPFFIGKYEKKLNEPVRPCLACAEGCLGGVKSGKGLKCLINPSVGEEKPVLPAKKEKYFAVIGAGPAGLEAASNLKQRGHRVKLFEKDTPGGQFNLAYLPPKKKTLKKLILYYKQQIQHLNIPVEYKEVKKEDILDKGYDGVILATGSVPVIPPIKGLKKYHLAEVLKGYANIENKTVLIIGGGLIGIEIASALFEKNRVYVVEMLNEVARGMEMIERALLLKTLKDRVTIYTDTKVKEIQGKTVILEGNAIKKIENVDTIILAAGMKSYNPLKKELEGYLPVYPVGDANNVGNAMDAISDAYQKTNSL